MGTIFYSINKVITEYAFDDIMDPVLSVLTAICPYAPIRSLVDQYTFDSITGLFMNREKLFEKAVLFLWRFFQRDDAVSALDEDFYSRTTKLYELTKNELLSDQYFAKVDGKDTFVITTLNNQEIYDCLLKFIKSKMHQVDEMFEVYNESLKLLK
jgi:hypothetical protein